MLCAPTEPNIFGVISIVIVLIILIIIIYCIVRTVDRTPNPKFKFDADELEEIYNAKTPNMLPELDDTYIRRTNIILTATVNVDNKIHTLTQKNGSQRADIYRKSIMRWLRYTRFKVIVVENSSFHDLLSPEVLSKYRDRLEFICFEDPVISKSKGQHESYAINYALYKSNLIHESDYIIKITGRYFVPDLESLLAENLGPKIDYIRQRISKRCEIIGCRYDKAEHLFSYPMKQYFVEAEYDQRLKGSEESTYQLPYVQVTTVKNGGYNQDVTYL